MGKESITIQDENYAISPRSNIASITQVKEDEVIIINRPANHNEISIMENDWSLIRDKVSRIKIRSGIKWSEIIIGAMIPYIIEIISCLCRHETPNYFPVIICLILYVMLHFISSRIPSFSPNCDDINKIHLQELNELLDRADSSKKNK